MSKNKVKFDTGKLWGKASALYSKRNLKDCLIVLEEIVNESDTPAYYCYIKATVDIEISKTQEALDELERAIFFDPKYSQAYLLRARIIYNDGGDLNSALSDAESALINYTSVNLSTYPDDPSLLSEWIKGYVAERSDIVNLKTSIESDIRSNQIYSQMIELESRVNTTLQDEKQRSFETLGIFAAIIALILATAQSATRIQGMNFLWLGLGLVLPIGFLVLLVTPRIENRIRGIIIILTLCLAAGLVGFFIRGYTG